MPARITPFRAAVHLQCLTSGSGSAPDCTRPAQRRLFHGTRTLGDDIDDKNHYETLSLQTNASPADIKKSFYRLSKSHHPDHNRADPHASRRFMRISEAYSVLSHTTSRAKYDRDVLRLHAASQQPTPTPRGSYASTGPAGGRPASGLSRRRGTFRGPPPSFYRSGGWGAHGAKRSAAHDESTAGASSSSSAHSTDARPEETGYTASGAGGMGPGQEPFGRGAAAGEMPHFDRSAKAAHTRTHDKIRERRMRSDGGFAFTGATSNFSEVGSFFAVLAVLGVTVGIPYVAITAWNSGSPKNKKGGG